MKLLRTLLLLIFLLVGQKLSAEGGAPVIVHSTDSVSSVSPDSLGEVGQRPGFTRFIYERIVSQKTGNNQLLEQYERLHQVNGKIVRSVSIKQLQIFGPSFNDTSRVTKVGIEKFANKIHTQTRERIIRKNILVDKGDAFDVEKALENERIIRLLPFIQDVQFQATVCSDDSTQIDLTVLTKDVFAFGIRGRFRSIDSGEIELYNQNIWGAGHQIGVAMVSNVDEKPYVGFEGSYSINNINGHFVNLDMAYSNTYRREGFLLNAEKQFLRTSTKWGGGAQFYRLYKTDRFYENDAFPIDFPLNYRNYDLWSGYAFQVGGRGTRDNLQLVFSGRFRNLKFYERPEPGDDDNQYFSNSRFYLGGISLSRRYYIRDQHILGYGITEDIPKGFLHEWVIGYDDNESVDRWYSHLYFSSGNLINYKPSYMFLSGGLGSFFNTRRVEQGQLELNWNYISRQFPMGLHSARQFFNVRYVCGIRRFDQEYLSIKNHYGIRGFYSDIPQGKQRLVLRSESVLFHRKEILNFNIAFFGFVDLGIIGSSRKIIFTQDYYTGIGGGIRLHNENLIFRTIQLRLAYYPRHPDDSHGFGASLREMGGTSFYSFQPRKPEPLQFK
ncbi:MAG: hypothetical protein ACK5JD_04055 [Mangrovibacterium sp.]